jgi:hypothetical protein
MARASVAFQAAKSFFKSLAKIGIKARTLWLSFFSGVAVGACLMASWVAVLAYAPDAARALIAQIGET